MTLAAKLNAFKQEFEPKLPAEVLAQMHQATRDLRGSGILQNAPKIGDTLPAFSLKNQDGATVSSADLLTKGPLIISFFRGSWCPYCMIELTALSEIAADVRAAGGTIVVISPQMAAKSKETHTKTPLDLDLLSDAGNAYAKALGVSFVLPDNLRTIYGELGNFTLPDYNGDDSWTLPIPTRLVVGQDGTITYAEVDADYTLRPEPSETLAALKGLAAARG